MSVRYGTRTANLGLSQFNSADCPEWITDYNQDMQRIENHVTDTKGIANRAMPIAGGSFSGPAQAAFQNYAGPQIRNNDVREIMPGSAEWQAVDTWSLVFIRK